MVAGIGSICLISIAIIKRIVPLDSLVVIFTYIFAVLLFVWLLIAYWVLCDFHGDCKPYKFTLDVIQALAPLIGALAIAAQLWEMRKDREGNEKRPT